jgi:glycosyltransferase involved in cell wall biosynthesis
VNPFYLGMDADVYLTFGVNWLSAEVAVSAAECGRQSIVCIASDYDLADIYRPGSRERSPGGEFANACYQALTRADRVLVQTQRQEDLARQRFGVDPIRIGNPVDLPRRRPSYSRGIAHYALWVGRSDTFHKRPMLCLELAKRNPAIPFLMILNRYDDQVHRAVERDAPPNVLLTERVAFHEMAWYYRRARVLLSTASAAFEGCPNTFLQAGAHGVPVLSLEADPGRMLASGCGYCAEGDLDALDCRLASLWREPRIAEEARARMWAHLDREHDADARTAELERFLLSL